MSKYEELYNNFKWNIPKYFNIGVACSDIHAENPPDKTALIFIDKNENQIFFSFNDLKRLSNKLSNALKSFGMVKGDRLGILLSQQPETLISHLAGFKLGLINVPLFSLFGPDALEYRLNNSETKILITDSEQLEKIEEIRAKLPELKKVIVVNKSTKDNFYIGFEDILNNASDVFEPENTLSDDPAIIIYTSGTTGSPKGALHAHRVLLGHLPGVELPHNFFPKEGDLFWTPADWAWIGGLFDVLFPSLYYGIPVVAYRMKKFDPEMALALIEKINIKNVFMPPTALKMLRNIKNIKSRYKINLRTVASGGESLGEETLHWGKEELGLEINEFYGQTEANLIVSNCSEIMEIKAGSMGRPVFGHIVKIVDSEGNLLPYDEEGEIAVKKGDPVMFLEYWKNPNGTKEKFKGEWMLTGDMGKMDKDGYIWFSGRNDDIISSGGYRIGPAEIEDCLLKHSAVSLAAVIGKPDKIRGEIVKAFIVLKDGYKESETLAKDIQEFVKKRLAAHEYPRELEFTNSLPMTITGKIMRRELRRKEIEKMNK